MSVLLEATRHPGADEARAAIASMDGLASQADLARRWGITRGRVHQLAQEPGFPEPVGQVNAHDVWLVAEADL